MSSFWGDLFGGEQEGEVVRLKPLYSTKTRTRTPTSSQDSIAMSASDRELPGLCRMGNKLACELWKKTSAGKIAHLKGAEWAAAAAASAVAAKEKESADRARREALYDRERRAVASVRDRGVEDSDSMAYKSPVSERYASPTSPAPKRKTYSLRTSMTSAPRPKAVTKPAAKTSPGAGALSDSSRDAAMLALARQNAALEARNRGLSIGPVRAPSSPMSPAVMAGIGLAAVAGVSLLAIAFRR